MEKGLWFLLKAYLTITAVWMSSDIYHKIVTRHNMEVLRQETEGNRIKIDKLRESLSSLPPAECTTEQAVKWWTNTEDMRQARKTICGK